MIVTYRNFDIQPEQIVRAPEHLQGLWRVNLRELPDGRWRQMCLLMDTEADAIKAGKKCVDYQYRVETWEFLNDRKYDPMKDGCIKAFE